MASAVVKASGAFQADAGLLQGEKGRLLRMISAAVKAKLQDDFIAQGLVLFHQGVQAL